MSEEDRSDGPPRAPSDQTLLGVAPPPIEPSPPSAQRSPVFVRSGTSVADVEPPPVPRMALPSRPPSSPSSDSAAAAASLAPSGDQLERTRRLLGAHPALWMLLAPGLLAVTAIALVRATAGHHGAKLLAASATATSVAEASPPPVPVETPAQQLARLKARPPESLTARELALLAEAQAEEARSASKALRSKIEANPALGKDPVTQRELLRLAEDARTSTDALSAMAALDAPTGADLLYEVWTHTPVRSDATDLARAFVYSTDVRPKTSPALAVALELRVAERCEQYKALLPKALKDGDRRSTHLLLKLSGKRGCGPKKSEDCYACLREQPDELTATINAVKSRRPPEFSGP
ncbi:MAG TPA: hypothetical protein VER96_13305 [Polyangiaceae bacterium]|nr:hypothetical protein [Polyangiaceae bacterium]